MEAREFLEKFQKMCKTYPICDGCPLKDVGCRLTVIGIDKLLSTVESWHRKTRKDALLEHYPNAILMDGGTPKACPKNLDSDYDCSIYTSCMKCREEYWNEAIE